MKKTLKLHQRTCVTRAVDETLGTFCYPTGTGKTLAEARIIVEHIRAGDNGIYIVLAPRIMLATQLFEEIWAELVLDGKINATFFALHSGKASNIQKLAKKNKLSEAFDDADDEVDAVQLQKDLRKLGLTAEQLAEVFQSSTSAVELRKAVDKAAAQGRPLVVISTYHSAERITQALAGSDVRAEIEASVMIADEGHNAVAVGFKHVHDLPAKKRFYFTATLKNTDGGIDGLGMQNDALFGPILDSLSPKDAVTRGLIVGPRVHYVEIEGVTDETATDADFKAIEAAFVAHAKAVGGIGAKLLVAARGTKEIDQIITHGKHFERLRVTRPNLYVFDISSAYGARINGEEVPRDRFLTVLQELKDHEEAIIIHYDILSEGIDVPGITGVMPLRSLGVSKFLQTLGRATRLHWKDRARLADEAAAEAEAAKLDWFVKPCAWLVLPCYGGHGDEIKAAAEMYVRQLRTFGWIPGELDLLTEAGGEDEPRVIGDVHPGEGKVPKMAEAMGELHQRFESQEEFSRVYNADRKVRVLELDLG